MAGPTETSQTFENLMENLEDTVERLQNDELSLEDALKAYEQGVHLIRQCETRLSEAEAQIQALDKDGKLSALSAEDIFDEDEEML